MLVLTLVALLGLALGPVLIAAGMTLVGEFIAGVAVAPLTLALYLCLLPAGPWPDDSGGRGRGDGPPDAPAPQAGPGHGVDWQRFEREFWAEVDRHASLPA